MIGYAYLEDLGEGIGDPSAHEEIDFFSSPPLCGRKGNSLPRGGKNKLTSANALQPRRRPRFPLAQASCANEIHGYNIVQANATYFPLEEANQDVYTRAAAQRHRATKTSSSKKKRSAAVNDFQVSRYHCVSGAHDEVVDPVDVVDDGDDVDDVDDVEDVDAAATGASPQTPTVSQQDDERRASGRGGDEDELERRQETVNKERFNAKTESSAYRAMLQDMVITTWQDLLLYALSGLLLIFFLEQVFQMGLNAPRGAVL